MEYQNAKFNKDGTVDVEINHPDYGWIPFTADPNDASEFGRIMHAQTKWGALPHIPKPTPQHVPRNMPDRDAAIRALIAGDTVAAQAAMGKMV